MQRSAGNVQCQIRESSAAASTHGTAQPARMATEGEGSSSSARRSELESSLSDQIAALHLQLEERDKEIEESYRVAFLNLLQGMCASSSSESGSQVDTARRGVPMAKMDADGLDFSDVLVNTVDAKGAWKRFCKSCESWSPPTTSGTLGETAHVHPIIERLLLAAASSATLSRLRVWRGKKSEDEIKVATIIPDFSVTPAGEGHQHCFFRRGQAPRKFGGRSPPGGCLLPKSNSGTAQRGH